MRTTSLLLLLAPLLYAQDPLGDALLTLRRAAPGEREAAVAAVLALQPDRAAVVKRLGEPFPFPAMEAGWHLLEAEDSAGVRRPYQLYVPKSVAGKSDPVPLLVHMHGGVSRPEYSKEEGAVGAGTLWIDSAERVGFVVAFPLGRTDCTWWTAAGARHVRAVIREVKRLVPVDDDQVFATGFSDGGSGCYYLAMAAPDPFAGFLAMNGHPAVAATASGEQLYLRNLARTPLYATMTADDALYPAAGVLDHLVPALRAGASVRIASWEEGNHRPVYFDALRATFEEWMAEHPRDPRPHQVDWWCAGPCSVAWVAVEEVGAAAGDPAPVDDLNVMSTPGRVRLGVTVDRAYEGEGVKIAEVSAGSTAEGMGLREGDVIVRLDDAPVAGLPELAAALGRKDYGDDVRVTVRRADGETTAAGRFAPFTAEAIYSREKPTSRLGVRVADDGIEVTSRNVRRLALYLGPGLPDPGVKVRVNGREAAPEAEEVGLPALLARYAAEADGGRVYTKVLHLSLPGG